jgi:aspartate aminotransferase
MIRKSILDLRQNGITKIAFKKLGDPKVIPLWFGEEEIPTQSYIRQAAKNALDDCDTYYGHTRGKPALRRAISQYLEELYKVNIDDARITVPGSAMLSVTMACQMTLDVNSHAIIITPHWPNIDRAIAVTGASFDHVRLAEQEGSWSLNIEALKKIIRPNTRALYVNSPSNPTGWVMENQQQIELLELCKARNITIIADEVYHRTVYGVNAAPSFLEILKPSDSVFVINSFSKTYAMTGWRIGWMVTPQDLEEQMATISECFNTSAPSFIQSAAITALKEGEATIKSLIVKYHAGREMVMDILGHHPLITLSVPQGAFYAFPRVKGLKSSLAFTESLLEKENVGVAPGYTFGPNNDDYFRLCFAQSPERLEKALERIVRHVENYMKN